MVRRPPTSTPTATRFPYTALSRSTSPKPRRGLPELLPPPCDASAGGGGEGRAEGVSSGQPEILARSTRRSPGLAEPESGMTKVMVVGGGKIGDRKSTRLNSSH